AVRHQRAAVKASPARADYREALRGHLRALADALLALGEHGRAAEAAAELVGVAAAGRLEAARILARCVPLAEADARLPEPERRSRAEGYAARAVGLLREAAQQKDKDLERRLKEADFDPLRSRDDFKALLDPSATVAGREPAPSRP